MGLHCEKLPGKGEEVWIIRQRVGVFQHFSRLSMAGAPRAAGQAIVRSPSTNFLNSSISNSDAPGRTFELTNSQTMRTTGE